MRAWGWIWRGFLTLVVLAAVALVFRQGWLPARYTPVPVLDLDHPLPIVTDWQLAELRRDRRMCQQMIDSSRKLIASPVPDNPIRKGCGWINAVRPTAFGRVSYSTARVSCPVAAAMALWIAYDVQPLARRIFGRRVVRLDDMGVYSCRNVIGSRFWKNRRSEHATANAVDIGGFHLDDGTHISVLRDWKRPGRKSEFLRAVHLAACSYFRVVLGPDFNSEHENHFHFDRGTLYTCR